MNMHHTCLYAALPTVTGLRVAAVSPSSITVEWNVRTTIDCSSNSTETSSIYYTV